MAQVSSIPGQFNPSGILGWMPVSDMPRLMATSNEQLFRRVMAQMVRSFRFSIATCSGITLTECVIARFPPICLAVAVAGRAGAANRRRSSSSVKVPSLLLSIFSNFDLDLRHSPRLIPPSPLVSFFRMMRDALSSARMVTCVERAKTNIPMSRYAHMARGDMAAGFPDQIHGATECSNCNMHARISIFTVQA